MGSAEVVTVALYLVAIVGIVTVLRRARSMEDFAVASRKIPALLVFGSVAATYVGPGYSIGLIGKAASEGYVWLLIFGGFVVQMVAMGLWVAPGLRRYRGACTLSDVMGQAYGVPARLLTSIITVLLMIAFVGVMGRAAAQLVSEATGLALLPAGLLAGVVVAVYTTVGGIRADLTLDCVHFVIMALMVPALAVTIMLSGSAASQVPAESSMAPSAVVWLFVSFLLGEALIPPYTARAFAGRSDAEVRRAFLWAAAFGLAWFTVCCAIGVMGGASGLAGGDAVYMAAARTFMPEPIAALLAVAAIGIVLSSWDSVLNGASVTFARDLWPLLARADTPRLEDGRRRVLLAKVFNVLAGFIALGLALRAPSVLDALMTCYMLWVPTVVPPAIAAAVAPRVPRAAAVPAMIVGAVVTIISQLVDSQSLGVPALVTGATANTLVLIIATLLRRGGQGSRDRGVVGGAH